MKKYFIIATALLCALAACNKNGDPTKPGGSSDDPSQPAGKDVTVTLTADESFDATYNAKAYLSLSEANTVDVVVKLGNASPQEGKVKVPADFDKEVTIPAGQTKVEVPLKADIMGLKEGDYQFALKIGSAKNATVGEPSVAYVNMKYIFQAEVNLFADAQFAMSCEASLKVILAKASPKDVTVKLELDSESKAEASFEKSVTVPAGETEKEIIVTVTVPKDLAAGTYPVIIKIVDVENGLPGKSATATINLNYPFTSAITIDGLYDDWQDALEWVTPADAEFIGVRTLKLAASPKKLYIYFEIVEPSPEDFNKYPMPVDIFLDNDANYDTGGKLKSTDNVNTTLPYVDSGLRWYIELGNIHLGQSYEDFTYGAYRYEGTDGKGLFEEGKLINKTGSYGAEQIFGDGELGEDGIGRIEIQLDRTFFELTGIQARVGIKLMNGNGGWDCYGLSPIGSMKGKESERVEMALINMPEYDES